MSIKITPNEFHLLNDNPVIRTNCLRENITDKMLLDVVKFGNLTVGDRVMVQCLNHERTELLYEREYRVSKRVDAMKTVDVDLRSTRQFMETTFSVVPVGDWMCFIEKAEEEEAEEEEVAERPRRGRPPKQKVA